MDDPGLTDQEMYERMVSGWRAGNPETVCGNGSTMAHTENVRRWLPEVVKRHAILRVNDAGAGDLYWIRKVRWQSLVRYTAFDLIPRHSSVEQMDITTTVMPPADAILCRMVLNHLDQTRICMALEQFKVSARFLIATQFNGEDLPKRSPQFTRLDLRGAPYNLGEPLESCQDGSEDICSLALWELSC
jgi:hypothetical protein